LSSYRFCRSDDVSLLVEAYNRCYRVHFPELQLLTVDGFKQWIRRLEIWTSSCMVASIGAEPIGVLIAGKRTHESLVFRVGVAPGHQRNGHASHLMDSLAQKLAILGPRRLVAEVPAERSAARRFVERCGYRVEARYTDFEHPGSMERPRSADLIFPVTVEELQANEALSLGVGRSWHRAAESLTRRADSLVGSALATASRIEAFALHTLPSEGPLEVLALGCADETRREMWLRPLLQQLCSTPRAVRLTRLEEGDPPFELIKSCGFHSVAHNTAYAFEAGETTA